MNESSGPQVFRTTAGIQSGPDALDESRFCCDFFTYLIEILCSFRLVIEGKTGKDIPVSSRLEFFKKFLTKNFGLSHAENDTSESLNRGGIADLPLLRTLLAICQSPERQVSGK